MSKVLLQSGISGTEWRQWRDETTTQAFLAYLKGLIESSQEGMTGVVMNVHEMEHSFALTNRLAGEQKTLFTILDDVAEATQEDKVERSN